MEGLFHAHSNYSFDGKCSLLELVEFCKRKHFGFVVLTEHAEDFSESKMQSYVKECMFCSNEEIILLPGLEFGFEEYPDLHLLGIGIKEYIATDDISTTVDKIHKQGGLAIIAHPSRNNYFVPEGIIEKIDGLEIWNAAYDSRYLPNHRSLKLYNNLKNKNSSLNAFSGLDMHDFKSFRELTLVVDGKFQDGREFLELLKRGQFINKGRLLSLQSKPEIGIFHMGMIMSGRFFLKVMDFVYWKFKK